MSTLGEAPLSDTFATYPSLPQALGEGNSRGHTVAYSTVPTFSILAHLSVCPLINKCVEIFSPKSMGFLKEIVAFLQNRPPSAGGPLKCVEICFQNRILAHLSVCPLKCVGTVIMEMVKFPAPSPPPSEPAEREKFSSQV